MTSQDKLQKHKLWGGRFKTSLDPIAEEISESISFDYNLYKYDIEASKAHAKMLHKIGILLDDEIEKLLKALDELLKDFENGKIKYDTSLEDIHTHIETALVERIGTLGKKIHTGRSRNDQVAVATHLFIREHIQEQKKSLVTLLELLLNIAKKEKKTIWAGYTHLQIAQPIYLSHYLLNYFFKFARDFRLLDLASYESSFSPLGAAAFAGANYPIDRLFTKNELGFDFLYENSMDAVSNRDYQLSYSFFASRLYIHISRLCEDLILYSSSEFQYIKFSDKVTTGSSIMPQKKNPDIAELLRGKTARVIGALTSLFINLKSLPMAYNRDLQEDKVYLFDVVKQVDLGIKGVILLLENTTFLSQNVRINLEKGFSQATDFADFLTLKEKIPFRDSHEIVGRLISYCEKNDKFLSNLSEDKINSVVGRSVTLTKDFFSLENCVERKQGVGATSTECINKQILQAGQIIKDLSVHPVV